MKQSTILSAHGALSLILGAVALAGPETDYAGSAEGYAYSYLADAEKLRRNALILQADEAYHRGREYEAAGDLEQAGAEYRQALDLLPVSPLTENRRQLFAQAFANVSTQLGRLAADSGNLARGRQYVQAALSAVPNYPPALELQAKLDDPEYYNPEYTLAHARNAEEVAGRLRVGRSHQDIGNYDAADDEAHEILRVDPYNTAARRLMERGELLRRPFRDASYDETRSRAIMEVVQKWEMPIPVKDLELREIEDAVTSGGTGADGISARLKSIIVPSISLSNVSIQEARERLEYESRINDPSGRGVNFVLDDRSLSGTDAAAVPITVHLRGVPLEQVLRYIVDLAGMVYRIENVAVVISAAGDETALFRKTYRVPPYFLSIDAAGGGGAGEADDPFAADAGAGAAPVRATAQALLEARGIVFPEGASAIFNAQRSELVVNNNRRMLELVDAFVDSVGVDVPKQVSVTTRFVEVRQENWNELGFDWYVGDYGARGDTLSLGGGTYGGSQLGQLEQNTLQTPFASRFVPFTREVLPPPDAPPGTPSDFLPVGQFNRALNPRGVPYGPSAQSLRTGSLAIRGNAIDALIRGEGQGGELSLGQPTPGIIGIAGIMTSPEFQVVMRGLNQKKGIDLLTAPTVMTKSGQRARIEVVRELIYPTEYDPPELPQSVGTAGDAGFPVTPANPTAFTVRNTGVTLEVDPVVGPDGFTLDLNLAPEVVEFEGFINYGSPITTAGLNILNQPVQIVITENRIDMPVFATRRARTNVTVWDGATVAIGGLIREDVQHVQDKIPVVGDLPYLGRLFRSESEQHLRRNLMIFVTAQLIDPAGSPIREGVGAGLGSGATSIAAGAPGDLSGPSSELLPPPEG